MFPIRLKGYSNILQIKWYNPITIVYGIIKLTVIHSLKFTSLKIVFNESVQSQQYQLPFRHLINIAWYFRFCWLLRRTYRKFPWYTHVYCSFPINHFGVVSAIVNFELESRNPRPHLVKCPFFV